MNSPLVSIIIPTYNRAHLISETLDSVLAQTYTNWECIIVDDGSTDNTMEVVNSYINKDPRFQLHHRPMDKPKGGNAARNYGFEVSKGEYVNWFDDDDVMLPQFLEFKIDSFHENFNFLITTGFFTNNVLEDREKIQLNENVDIFKEYLLWKSIVLTPSVFFSKAFLNEKELFLDSIIRGQETEFFSRLFFQIDSQSYKIINEPLFLYRQHDATKSIQNLEYNWEFKESYSFVIVEIFKKCVQIRDSELSDIFYKILIKSFFESLEYKHNRNARYILSSLQKILKYRNLFFCIELLFFGNLILLISKESYAIKKRWIQIKISFK